MMNNRSANKKTLIITEFDMRNHPQTEWVLLFAQMLQKLGYDTSIHAFSGDCTLMTSELVDGINICIYGYRVTGSRVRRWLYGKNYLKTLFDTQLDFSDVSHVYFFGDGYTGIPKYILRKSTSFLFKPVAVLCERYDKKRLLSFWGKPTITDILLGYRALVLSDFAQKRTFVHFNNVICVSSYMKAYYEKMGCKCFLLPILSHFSEFKYEPNDTSILKLGYFGNPGQKFCKDRLDLVIQGMRILEEKSTNVELSVYGVDVKEIQKAVSVPSNVKLFGRIEKKKVKDLLSTFDFSVLLRDDTPSINFGLSSKMVESMVCGVPLICNLTSDMGKYIQDGYNGLVCQSNEADAFAERILDAMHLSKNEILEMHKNAYYSSKRDFTADYYLDDFRSFVEGI